MKRIHVAQRENPIVNRLNKTKIEKYPDLAMERENRQKELRKKDRATQQARVSLHLPLCCHPQCPSATHSTIASLLSLPILSVYSAEFPLITSFLRNPPHSSRPSDLANEVLQQKEEARVAKERKEKAWQKDHAYDDLLNEDNIAMSSNQDRDPDFLDDFF